MKAVAFSEALLLLGLLALGWFVYMQQEELGLLTLEVDRLRNGLHHQEPVLPVADFSANSSGSEVKPKAQPRPRAPRKPKP